MSPIINKGLIENSIHFTSSYNSILTNILGSPSLYSLKFFKMFFEHIFSDISKHNVEKQSCTSNSRHTMTHVVQFSFMTRNSSHFKANNQSYTYVSVQETVYGYFLNLIIFVTLHLVLISVLIISLQILGGIHLSTIVSCSLLFNAFICADFFTMGSQFRLRNCIFFFCHTQNRVKWPEW